MRASADVPTRVWLEGGKAGRRFGINRREWGCGRVEYCTRGGILERIYVQGAVFGGLGFVRWGLRRVVGLDCFV